MTTAKAQLKEYVTKDLTGLATADIEATLNGLWNDGYALTQIATHQVWGSDRIRSVYIFKRRAGRPPQNAKVRGL